MDSGKIITNVVGSLLIIAIMFVYSSIGNLTNSIHKLDLKITEEVGLLRAEIGQYHAILGVQQRDIDRIEKKLDKNH